MWQLRFLGSKGLGVSVNKVHQHIILGNDKDVFCKNGILDNLANEWCQMVGCQGNGDGKLDVGNDDICTCSRTLISEDLQDQTCTNL